MSAVTRVRTHYDNLKVARDAPDFVIRAAYRTLSQKYHPDKNAGDERAARIMAAINRSYAVLSDPGRRQDHDAWIFREERKLRQQSQQAPSGGTPRTKHHQTSQRKEDRGNLLAGILLAPLKLMFAVIVAVPRLAVFALLFGGFWLWSSLTPERAPSSPRPGPKPYQAEAPVTSARASEEPAYSRPPVAPNGNPWPEAAAYVPGYPVDHDDGYSNVTVDNTRNDGDVFVKLVSLDEDTAYPVRQFYIPAGSRFKAEGVTAGTYDLRYRDLGSGRLSRSQSFDVDERRTRDGVEYSEMTMTLYKVQGGNFRTYDLAEAEF